MKKSPKTQPNDRASVTLARRIDTARRNVISTMVAANAAATKIENILSDPKAEQVLQYAVRALLVELSNESQLNVDTPGIAGTFYRVAALELHESDNIHVQQGFRHIAVLLSSPNAKTANALIKYWDDHRSKNLKVDPFPAKPDPFADRKRPKAKR